jgi:hypothetical protein
MFKVSASRVVAFVTPILAAGSAVGTPWLVKATGLHISPADVTALAVTGATAVVASGLKWLDGNSKWEREYNSLEGYFKEHIAPDLDKAEKAADAADPGIVADIEGQADKVVEAAKAKLVAVLTPAVDPTPAAPVVPAAPEPEAAA